MSFPFCSHFRRVRCANPSSRTPGFSPSHLIALVHSAVPVLDVFYWLEARTSLFSREIARAYPSLGIFALVLILSSLKPIFPNKYHVPPDCWRELMVGISATPFHNCAPAVLSEVLNPSNWSVVDSLSARLDDGIAWIPIFLCICISLSTSPVRCLSASSRRRPPDLCI
ncbi:hypothetical protein B0H11DRAFT_2020557 [Mycena galericulata]|nr:hypothetical protein B0H11DRAFT_2020557 [Mycena galericulata]